MNILLQGASGTGKTTSLKTLAKIPELKVFAIFTEPRYDILGGDFLSKIHHCYVPPAAVGWSSLTQMARQINTLSNDSLQKLASIDGQKYTQFLTLINQCNDFIDQNGVHHGDVATWNTDRVLVIDGLTGVSKMARKLRVGSKPVLTQPDWGAAMTMVQEFIDALTTMTKCHLILITHIERETDEVSGSTKIMVSTLGRKLAPMIPPNFGDVIMATKNGSEFYWDTADGRADLKNGFLPIGSKIPSDYAPMFHKWQSMGGLYVPTAAPVAA